MSDKDKPEKLELPKLKEPTSVPPSPEAGKNHVDVYLQARAVRLWERGGKRAYAIQKGREFGTDKEFDDLFKAY